MLIKLDEEQQKYAMRIATERHEAKDISFRNETILCQKIDNSIGIPREYMPHFVGVMGEMAWGIFNGLKIDENIYEVRDPGFDFENTEIKTITYFGRGEPELKIQIKEFEKRKPDLYVLTRVNVNTSEVEILGKITRSNFDKIKIKKKYGENHPENFVVPLSKMEKL